MVNKKLNEMNKLELEGMLFECNAQISQIQKYAQESIVPLINKLVEEEKKAMITPKSE